MMSLGQIRRMRKRLAVFIVGGPISSDLAGFVVVCSPESIA
jgi:hypothetical protein